MSWREVTTVSERLKLCQLASDDQFSVAELARMFGVSRKSAYKWISRYKEQGELGVWDRSRRPINSPSAVGDDLVEAVLSLHEQYPAWGPRKLHVVLCRNKGDTVSSLSTVARILKRAGISITSKSEIVNEVVGRFQRGKPNELWQIDFTSAIKLSDGSRIWPVPILDDHSRYCVSLIAAADLSGASALSAFRNAGLVYGVPEEILSDHGGAFGSSSTFISAFTTYMWALGISHCQGRYAHPQTQGKLERFNQTLIKECIIRHSYNNIGDWNKCFEEYRNIYNQQRPHQSLSDRVPADIYVPSQRLFSEPDKDFVSQEQDLLHRRVGRDGRIALMKHRFDVGNGLAGWMVSARHDGGGIWTVHFRGRAIRQVSLALTARPCNTNQTN
jgi:transposase InsO family protein